MMEEKKRVLIAEDDEDVILVLKEGLKGYEFITAKDGKEAYKKIKSEHPDLIILDVMMPEINGADLNKRLKREDEVKDIPVLIITGRPNLRGLFSDSGVNKVSGFLEKPFSLKILKEELEKIINK